MLITPAFEAQILGPLATVIGAAGGFPTPPKVFSRTLEKYPVLQWALVYALVWQGQANRDEWAALWATCALWVLFKIWHLFDDDTPKKPTS